MSVTEVTVAQFRRYVETAQARPRATRRGFSTVYDLRSGNFVRRSGVDWRSGYDGRAAGPDDPVLHVSVRDAVMRRQLLVQHMPGSPAALAVSQLAGKFESTLLPPAS